ncbi:MAG TPA: arginine--tRNA ligase [Planctomycetota bacterium]|nr:arginine--tRNA ligase [Planctomycetota bacterium]
METNTSTHAVHAALVNALVSATGLSPKDVAAQLGRPPKPEMGDYAFPCFAYGKQNKLPPPQAAAQLAEKLKSDPRAAPLLKEASPAGPFLNIGIQPGQLSAAILSTVRAAGEKYGHTSEGAGKTIVIDYSSPNIAKPFHVGHLMSTALGASLVRIYRALGYKVVGVNFLGDWGVQCGFQFLAWQREDPAVRERELAARKLDYLAELYVEINAPAKKVDELASRLAQVVVKASDGSNVLRNKEDLSAEDKAKLKAQIDELKVEADKRDAEARALFKKLEAGDPELKKLWELLRNETIAYLKKIYERMGVSFESYDGEAYFEPMLKPMVAYLQAFSIAVESQGAIVIPMEDAPKPGKEPKPPLILLKSDGTTIYATRDLAAAIYRKLTYSFTKNIYVVDMRQSHHLNQVFKGFEKAGHGSAKDCVHVAFGLMQVKEDEVVKPMSTRAGAMIPLNELFDKMVEVVRNIVKEKNPDLAPEKAARVAEAVGVGAVVFWAQGRRRMSNAVFDWKQATDPNGDTGPYLQYQHARVCSILRKAGATPEILKGAKLDLLVEPEETGVAKALEQFPSVLKQAAEDYEPSLISTYLLDVASALGRFLNRHRVIDSPPELRAARLALVDAVRGVLAQGLGLLGITAPDEM